MVGSIADIMTTPNTMMGNNKGDEIGGGAGIFFFRGRVKVACITANELGFQLVGKADG